MYFLTKEEGAKGNPFTKWYQAQMYCKSFDVPATIELPAGQELIMPGEDKEIAFHVRKGMVSCIFP